MTKGELVDKLSEQSKITKKLAKVAIDSIFDTMAAGLVAGEEISIPGFGEFSINTRKARIGTNRQTK